jgi:hypothetical protein
VSQGRTEYTRSGWHMSLSNSRFVKKIYLCPSESTCMHHTKAPTDSVISRGWIWRGQVGQDIQWILDQPCRDICLSNCSCLDKRVAIRVALAQRPLPL